MPESAHRKRSASCAEHERDNNLRFLNRDGKGSRGIRGCRKNRRYRVRRTRRKSKQLHTGSFVLFRGSHSFIPCLQPGGWTNPHSHRPVYMFPLRRGSPGTCPDVLHRIYVHTAHSCLHNTGSDAHSGDRLGNAGAPKTRNSSVPLPMRGHGNPRHDALPRVPVST